jgi:hypothetical protein
MSTRYKPGNGQQMPLQWGFKRAITHNASSFQASKAQAAEQQNEQQSTRVLT